MSDNEKREEDNVGSFARGCRILTQWLCLTGWGPVELGHMRSIHLSPLKLQFSFKCTQIRVDANDQVRGSPNCHTKEGKEQSLPFKCMGDLTNFALSDLTLEWFYVQVIIGLWMFV